jgi:hypothetical protein
LLKRLPPTNDWVDLERSDRSKCWQLAQSEARRNQVVLKQELKMICPCARRSRSIATGDSESDHQRLEAIAKSKNGTRELSVSLDQDER